MYSTRRIANYYIDYALKSDYALQLHVNPMKLQKLIYFAHGWHLAILNKPLLKEDIHAWSWGVVIPSLYYDLRNYGNTDIIACLDEMSFDKDFGILNVGEKLEKETCELLDRVWIVYSPYTHIQLANMTNMENTPWYDIYEHYYHNIDSVAIPNDLIKEYFTKLDNMNRHES